MRQLPAISLAVLVLALSGCSSKPTSPPVEPLEFSILNEYTIVLPATYSGGTLAGRDTYIFQARRDDEEVVLNMEVGPGTALPRPHFDELPEHYRYANRKIITTKSGAVLAYYYESDDEGLTFRDYLGTVVAESADGDGYTELLNTSHSGQALEEVLSALATLHRER